MPDFLNDVTLGQVALVAGLVTVVVGGVMKAWPWLSRFKDFMDDLMGEPARPGVEARPGVVESVSRLSKEMMEIRAKVTSADYHSRPNGGNSSYDRLLAEVTDMRGEVQEIHGKLAEHVKQASEIHEEQAAAIAYLAEGDARTASNLSEAMGPAIRATPHDDDV